MECSPCSIAAKIPMIAITTSSSIKVKPSVRVVTLLILLSAWTTDSVFEFYNSRQGKMGFATNSRARKVQCGHLIGSGLAGLELSPT